MAVFKTSYNLDYSNYATGTYVADGFGYVQPHAPRMIIETPTGQDGCCDEGDPRIKKKLVNYDANGNQLEITEVIGEDEIIVRKNLWDEENRLRAVDLNPDNDEHHNIAVYTYDASGQRILRHIPTRVDVYSNATLPAQKERDVTMIYPSGLITAKVINPDSWGTEPGPVTIPRLLRYTKHYYIGTERISSATDTRSNVGYFIDNSNYNDFFPVSTVRQISNETVIVAGDALEEAYGSFGLEYTVPAPVVEDDKPHTGETDFFAPQVGRYFFHPDHLGSSSYITDKAGVVSQHMEYLPFGELLVDEHLNSHNSPFKFNAKELDAETGNYYYGARYYDSKWSMWLSVDPLAEEFPNWTPYHYVHQNPLRYTDPLGMSADDVIIKGKLADKAVDQLNASTSLEITRDQKTGKLSATGEAKTESDQLLLEAINDEKITVKIRATNRNKQNGKFLFGDSFQGSKKKRNGEVVAKQTLNPNQAAVIEDFAEMPEGSVAKHAVLEAFLGAQNDPGAYPQQKNAYLRAHNATNAIYPAGDFDKIAEEKSIRIEIRKSPFSKTEVWLLKPGGEKPVFY